jgi:hypothetical protein
VSGVPAPVADALAPGERINWTGKPLPPQDNWPHQRRMITVSLAAVLCAVVAMIAVGGQSLGTWMGPVILIGGLIATELSISGWWGQSDRRRLSRTTYAATFDRVLAFEDGLHAPPHQLELDGPYRPRCENNRDGTVSIWLRFHTSSDGSFDRNGSPMIDREPPFVRLERLSNQSSAYSAIIEARTAKLGPWAEADIASK